MIRPEHQFDIRPDLHKAASTKAESTTAESVIRPKQLVMISHTNYELPIFQLKDHKDTQNMIKFEKYDIFYIFLK